MNTCEDCNNTFKVDLTSKYKRKFPNKCQTCARKFNRSKLSVPTHGHRMKDSNGNPKRSKLYMKWVNMKCSCYTPTYKDYKYIGAKGIQMDKTWKTFEGFLKWSKTKFYVNGMTLKRIDNTKDFTPNNCKFIAKRANKFIEFRGEQHTLHTLKKKLNSTLSEKQ